MFKVPEAIGPVINVELALSDVATTDELVGIMEVPVGSISVLVLLSGSSVEVELAELGAETLSTVTDAVPFTIDAVINEAVRVVPVGARDE